MSRRLSYNTVMGVVNQIIVLICNFLLPRQILLTYGSDTNGLITSITQFLGFITLMEMGVGAVVQSALYEPLANNDHDAISRIIKSSRSFFNKLGLALFIYIIILCFFYRRISGTDFSNCYVVPLVLAISITNLCEYFIGITNQLLLNADQRAYIQLGFNSLAIVLNTSVGIILMKIGASVQVYEIIASLFLAIKPLGMLIYVKRHYKINCAIEVQDEPIKQKWNGIAQHIASFILGHTDVLVLTVFSTLKYVSVYNVYYMVVAGVRQFINVMMTGVTSLFGNLYAQKSPDLIEKFNIYEWIMHFGVCVVFTATALLICPFISIYTSGITDIDYVYPTFGLLLSMAYGFYCIRLPYNTMVLAAGHFKQTQNSAIIEAIINIVVSIALVKRYGIYGVAVGTLLAMGYRTFYLAWYLSRAILYRKIFHFLKHLAVDAIIILVSYFVCAMFTTFVDSFFLWVLMAIKVTLIIMLIGIVVNWLFYREEILFFWNKFFRKLQQQRNVRR